MNINFTFINSYKIKNIILCQNQKQINLTKTD
jgi:hypothetical protein